MKTTTPLHRTAALFALALLALFAAPRANAQTLATLSSSNYTQNFNSMGTSGTAGMPTGWFTTTTATNFTGTTNTTVAYGTTGTGVVTGSSGGGIVNWADGITGSSTDRALGILNTGSFTSGKSILFGFTNTTGSSITNLSLAWDYEKYRSGTRAWTWTFAYSTNGSTWITNASGGQDYAADANNTTVNNPPTTNSKSFNIGSLSIGNNSSVYLRWTLDGDGGSSNGQGLAVDNFNMTAFYSALIAGNYWAPASGGGGTGTWSSSSGDTVWSTAAGTQGTGPQAATGTLIFGNNAGTVTVSGAVTAVAGLQFSTDGYTVTGGTSISLTGADAAANTITTDASVGATINTVLAGANGMTKAGTGTLTLGGANTYTGGTAVTGGRLVGTTASLQGNITNSAAVTFNQSTNGTYSDAISGTGSVVKAGSGSLTLSGTSSYNGGTTVSGGTLVGDTRSLQGAIANNAAVTFDQNTNGTYGGVMSGSGSLAKAGTGTTTLSGSNTYNGGTLVSAGRLVGTTTSLQGAITNNAAVTFNQSTSGAYNGVMSGSGALAKAGSGTVTLGGNNSGYNGTIDLQAGGLIAANNNALGSSAVTLTNGSIQAANGVTVANDFTIGTADSTGLFYSQDFNSLGTSSTAALPTGWKFSAAAQGTTSTFWTDAGNLTATTQAASSGSPTAGGRYNWGFSNDTGNRSIGFMSSGSYDEPNSIMFAFTNTTGQAMTNLIVSFDYLRFRTNSTAISNVFYLSGSSTSWGTALSTNTWGTGSSGYNFAPVAVSLTSSVTLNLAAGGVGYMMWTFDPTTDGNSQGLGLDNLVISNIATASGSGTLGISEAGTATFSGNVVNNNDATFTAATGGTAIFSNVISGAGTVTKTGAGTVTLSGASANTFTGATTVSAGTLQLNKSTDAAAIAGNIEVNDGAFLLLSSSGNVADTSAITLSGGTITRASGVSEVFGALTLTDDSFLDFGTGTTGTLSFGTYSTPSSLLTVQNFFQGNTLTFASDLTGSINNASLFSFDNGFTSTWNSGTSTFTITAIPEPSTYLAAAGLLGLMLWPSRRRIIRDTKKILGITPPMRDRLARRASEG